VEQEFGNNVMDEHNSNNIFHVTVS